MAGDAEGAEISRARERIVGTQKSQTKRSLPPKKNPVLSFAWAEGSACDPLASLHGQVAEQPCESSLGEGGQASSLLGQGLERALNRKLR